MQLVFEFSDSQAVESELDTLEAISSMVKLFDMLTQGGTILSKEVRDEKWIIRGMVWGGVGCHIESDGR